MWRLYLLVLVPVLVFVMVSNALQCDQMTCDTTKCKEQPTAESCESKCLTKDKCGCCDVCAKAKDQPCGGIYDRFGYCADGLYCIKADPSELVGKCKCLPTCTIDYCRGAEKDKLCSAKGMMKNSSNPDGCEHTTCGSCFQVAKQTCMDQHRKCMSVQQTKENKQSRCLKEYFVCLRRHYKSGSSIQNLTADSDGTDVDFIFCKESPKPTSSSPPGS